jgi:hypothetical protein
MMAVKFCRLIVLCIDEQHEDGGRGRPRAAQCVSYETRAKTTSPKALIDRQSPNKRGGQIWVFWKPFRNIGWDISKRRRCSCKSVVTGDSPTWRESNEAVAHSAALILPCLFS